MAKTMYVGDENNITRKLIGGYVGDENGIARKLVKGYVGDENGIARLFFAYESESIDLTILQDFEYTDNGDGTYTLTAWKGTLNGESSTKMVTPDNEKVIVKV